MKTLKAFWHWVDNEKPPAELYAEKAGDNLSDIAHQALIEAERLVGVRAGVEVIELDHVLDTEHVFLRPAWRDLSLALCAALEHMHGQVPDDYLGKRYPARADYQTHASVPEKQACPACGVAPCQGSSVMCDPHRYLREQQRAMNDQMFRREYLGDWVKGVDLSADASKDALRYQQYMQLVNASPDTFRSVGADGPKLANMPGRVLGRPVMNDDGLKLLRPELGWTHTYDARTGSNWDSAARRLEVYTSIDIDGVNRLRGLSPRTITIRGKAADYAPHVLPYLREVIYPMAMCSAVTNFPEADETLKLALGF